jgi:carboxyl-terminal processing protease
VTVNWLPELTGTDRFLLLVSLKSGLVLALAWAAAQLLRVCRASPASRHAVWALMTGGVLVLPFLVVSLPEWRIALRGEALSPTAVQPIAGATALPGPTAKTETALTTAPSGTNGPASLPTIATEGELPAPGFVPSEGGRFAEVPWLSLIWLVVACLMLIPAILGGWRLWRLGRSSCDVTADPHFALLRRSMDRLGMKGSIRLLLGQARSMPMTWGIRRATILLPEEARRWSEDRLRIVLLHELAHVRRRDCLCQLLAQLARAIYWFNPLSWLAERQMRALMEDACDDLVLTAGIEPPDYAEHLLAISAECRPLHWAAGMAMARVSSIERRLASILNPCQSRRPFSRRRLAPAVLLLAALIAPLSIARLAPALGIEPPAPGAEQDPPSGGPGADSPLTLDALRARIAEQYVSPVDDAEIIRSAIKAMIGALHDPYSDYLTPEMLADMEKQIGGTVAGIGAQLEAHEGKIRVVTPLLDSPALKAGLEAGDIILQIDGGSTAGLALSEAVKRIAGPPGSQVNLTIGREGGRELELTITRSLLQLPSVKGFRRGPDHRWDFLLDPAHRIGYVQIAYFGNTTPQEVRQAVEELKGHGLDGLIIDLRSCPGGLLESSVAVARVFLDQGTIVSIQGRSGELKVMAVDGSSVLPDAPLVVLVNGVTASAAEVVAGSLKDNHRALVVGTRTLGKGSVQTLIKLEEGGGAIKLTTARYQLLGGRSIDRVSGARSWGIDPDEGFFIPVGQGQAKELEERRKAREVIGKGLEAPEERDPQLSAALSALIARLESGRYSPASHLSSAEIEAYLKREEIQSRRSSLERDLERIKAELDELEKETQPKG